MAYFPPNDFTGSASIGALNAAVTIINLNGQSTLTVQVPATTLVGTMIFEANIDGSTWVALYGAINQSTNVVQSTIPSATAGEWTISITGFNQVRIRCNAYTSGSVTVSARASYGVENSLNGPYGQAAAVSSLPVTLSTEDVQDVLITGQSGQAATVNNILTPAAGSTATDTIISTGLSYKSAYVQIVGTGNTSGGTIIMEGSNDNTTFFTMQIYQLNTTSLFPVILSTGISTASAPYLLAFNIPCRYIRCRISGAVSGGGTIQAFTKFSQNTFIPSAYSAGVALTSSASMPVSLASDNACDQYITGIAAQSTININIILNSSVTAALDTLTPATITGAGGFGTAKSFSCQINGSAGISAGQVSFEGSNDNATFVAMTVYDEAQILSPINTPITIAASTQRFFAGKTTYRYIRCRISTAFTGGTVQAFTKLSNVDYVPRVITYNWNTTTGDSGAKTVTFNGATQTNPNAAGARIFVLCGTVSGTTPTMTAQLQWSPDSGTTWVNIGPASATITATGNSILLNVYPTNFSQTAGATPTDLTSGATQSLQLNTPLPRTWRLVYTITGTTPSFSITGTYVNYQI